MKKLANFIISSAANMYGSFDNCPNDVKSLMLEKVGKRFNVSETDLMAEITTILVFGE
jgi:hypothetical protein